MTNVGEVVALNMKSGECIQGRIKSVDADTRLVLVERPFLNGKPLAEHEKTFPINAIVSFRVLDVKTKIKEEIISEGTTVNARETHGDTAVIRESKTRSTELNTQRNFTGSNILSDYSLKVHRVNFKKESTEATTSPHKNYADNDGTGAFPAFNNGPVHVQQQQSPCSSPSGSSCSSPITKPTIKLGRGRGTHVSSGKRFSTNSSEPKPLSWTTGSSNRGRRNRGQCGILELDAAAQNSRDKKTNEGLTKPIDFDLNEDFDFEKNLEIFRNYEKNAKECERKEMSALGTQFAQKNYEHFENVISDPSRVTSWTTRTHDQFVASRFERTVDGQRMPFLKPSDKEKFLQRAEPYLGSDMFHVMIADRLMMFIWSIIDRFEIMVSQMVVLDSAAVNTFLTTMFLRHISNRACQTVVYSCLLGQYNLPHVLQVHNVQELPKHGVQLVVVLGPLLLDSVKDWIKNLWPSAHLVCIEKSPELIKNEHILMVGVGTDHDDSQKRKNPDSLRGVADIGIPFAWMDVDSAACLSRTFATQNIVLC
uniref:DFDF domain-containing protein n=1 Tax=Setaria digitata TaxID=48799 RepID=A0A915PWJ0_9BILA